LICVVSLERWRR